jgi:hypothetical protein
MGNTKDAVVYYNRASAYQTKGDGDPTAREQHAQYQYNQHAHQSLPV